MLHLIDKGGGHGKIFKTLPLGWYHKIHKYTQPQQIHCLVIANQQHHQQKQYVK